MFYAIAHPDEYESRWRTAGGWGLGALAVLLFIGWNSLLPKPYFHLRHHLGLIIDLIILSAIVAYFYRSWRKSRGGQHD
jgi:hypothetical protein